MSVLPHRIRTCVKVPYNLAKFHTVKFVKNFNVKTSMKFSRQENFMKFSITTCIRRKSNQTKWEIFVATILVLTILHNLLIAKKP